MTNQESYARMRTAAKARRAALQDRASTDVLPQREEWRLAVLAVEEVAHGLAARFVGLGGGLALVGVHAALRGRIG